MPIYPYNPGDPFLSLFRALESYLEQYIDQELYTLVAGFPSADDLGNFQPFPKTIIHYDIDDIQNPILGFGSNKILQQFHDDGTVTEIEARQHVVSWDIGVWASDRSGGITSRLVAYQLLNSLFHGTQVFHLVEDAYGFEILSFVGGNFIKEEINDMPIYRVTNMSLTTKIFSSVDQIPLPVPSGFDFEPGIMIDDEVIFDL